MPKRSLDMGPIKLDINKERAIKHILKGTLHKERIVFARELLQNSLDAVTNKRKILLHYDMKGQIFSIEDFGVGISEADVMEGGILRTLFHSKKGKKQRGRLGLGFFTTATVATKVLVDSRKKGASPFQLEFRFKHKGRECQDCKIFPRPGKRKKEGTLVKCCLDRNLHGYKDDGLVRKIREICRFIPRKEAEVRFSGEIVNEGIEVPNGGVEVRDKNCGGWINFYEGSAHPRVKILLRDLFVCEIESPLKHVRGVINVMRKDLPVTIGRTQLLGDLEDSMKSLITGGSGKLVDQLKKRDSFSREERDFLLDYSNRMGDVKKIEGMLLFEDIYGEFHSLKDIKGREVAFGRKDLMHDSATHELGVLTLKGDSTIEEIVGRHVPEKRIISDSLIAIRLEEKMKELPFKPDSIDRKILKAAEEIIKFLREKTRARHVKRPYSVEAAGYVEDSDIIELNVASDYYTILRRAVPDDELLRNALSWLICHELAHKVATHGDVRFENEMERLLEEYYRRKIEYLSSKK